MKDSKTIIKTISSMKDIEEIKNNKDIKYINIDISNPNLDAIYYLIENGQNYSYAEKIEDKNGYIYVSHDIFSKTQLLILEAINKIPIDLNELEIARYLYILVGKNIGYDINSLPDKAETFNLNNISTINNIWGSFYDRKGTNTSLTKIYLYLCKLMNIDCQIATSNSGYTKNIITIQNRDIMLDITQDIPYIQAGLKTKYFIGYNDNISLDKKVGYIKETYNEINIERALKNIDYNDDKLILNILQNTSNIISANRMGPIELSMIYHDIFNQYCPNNQVDIYNLYINNYPEKEHFIIVHNNGKYYSFNYTKNKFVEIEETELIRSIEEEKVGVYLNEKIPFMTTKNNIAAL